MAVVCSQHPEAPALYECDGCKRNLCSDCINSGHALLFCKVCGERALPLAGAPVRAAGSTQEAKRLAAIRRPYSLGQAFAYPFRGLGIFLFIAALLCKGGLEVMVRYGTGCYRFIFALAFWSLMIGLQFKIVRSTANGENELPDWPDYFSWGERLHDILIYLIITFWQFGLAAIYAYAFRSQIFTTQPNLVFWILFAVIVWLGIAVGTLALGSVGKFMPDDVLRIDRHFRAFRACGRDAVIFTNLLFALGGSVWLVRLGLTQVPIVGTVIAGILGTYWLFVSAHLSGLLFRRHADAMAEIYG